MDSANAGKINELLQKEKSTLSIPEKITLGYCLAILFIVAIVDTYFLVWYRKDHERHRTPKPLPTPPPQKTKHPSTFNYSWKSGTQCFQMTTIERDLNINNCPPGQIWIYNPSEKTLYYKDSLNYLCIEAYNASSTDKKVIGISSGNTPPKCKGVTIVKQSDGNYGVESNGAYIGVNSTNQEVWNTSLTEQQKYTLEPY